MKALIIITGITAYLGLIFLLIRFFAVCAGREPGLPINGAGAGEGDQQAERPWAVGGGADGLHSSQNTYRGRNDHG